MLSIEGLKKYGANTDEGLGRCMNNQDFYFRLIKMAVADPNFAKLEAALSAEDWKGSFEAAHALKGVLGNLSLTPMFDAASELTELLRPQQPCEYKEPLEKVMNGLAELKAMIEE